MTWKPLKPVAIERLIGAKNICPLLDNDDLVAISRKVVEGYNQDVESRDQWSKRQAMANKLALQVVEQTTDPWPNAANIKFPLVTVAAMQFQARAYPSLFSGTELVKTKIIGPDPTGEKTARGERIATHMTWQCLEQDRSWEEDHDKLTLVTAIAGCAFVKQMFEAGPGRIMSMLVHPKDLVLNYWTKSLDESPRYTHTFYLTANNIRQREIDGRFREMSTEVDVGYPNPNDEKGRDGPVRPDATLNNDQIQEATDRRQGLTKPQTDDVTPWWTGEQYCWLDLDGDGYEEPYIVVFDIGASAVRRIVARYLPSGVKFDDSTTLTKYAVEDGYAIPSGLQVYKITPVRVFTKYAFVPSPDGGFYDLGLGSLEGPINAAVNTIINQMVDTGTMKLLGGGFVGRGFKGKGGPITFAPNQWQVLDATGDDIRKSVLPLPVPDIPTTLFQLLGLLIQYAERIVSATDIQMGEQDMQNQKAETTRILNENGARVYSGIFKRFWRSARHEYDVRYELNTLYFQADKDFTDLTQGPSAIVRPDDYLQSAISVRPAADPHIVSDEQALKQSVMLVQWAAQTAGANKYRANLRFLKAQKVPNIEELYPEPKDPQTGKPMPDYPPPPNPKMMEFQLKAQAFELKKAQFQSDQQEMKVNLVLEAQKIQAEIEKLHAEALKLSAEAKGANVEPLIKLIYAHIEAEGKRKDRLLKFADMISSAMEKMNGGEDSGGGSGVVGAQAQPAVPAVPGIAKTNGAGAPGLLG